VLKYIKQSFFTENKILSNKIKQARWPTLISLEVVDTIASSIENISVLGLYHYARFLDANHQDSRNYWLFFWTKIISPFSIAVMLFLSAPFVFDVSRTSNIGNRLMIGVAIGISFTMANKLSAQIGLIYNLSPLIAASFITLLSFFIAVIFIRRIF
jgi:lipopolysaccharide export system permease protein